VAARDWRTCVKRDSGVSDVYYKFTLNLVDVETGIIEWSDEKEVRKQAHRAISGPRDPSANAPSALRAEPVVEGT
jgi:hypothetical protein